MLCSTLGLTLDTTLNTTTLAAISSVPWALMSAVTVFSVAMLLGHYYVWRRVVKNTLLPVWLRRSVTLVIILAGAAVPAAMVTTRLLRSDVLGWEVGAAFAWLGFLFYLVAILGLVDIIRMTGWAFRAARRRRTRSTSASTSAITQASEALDDRGRRVFVARAAAATALVGAGSVGALGLRSAMGEIATPDVLVRLERLPRALDGFTIAHLSDLHIGPYLGRDFVEGVVAQVNALKPDLIVITGDLVDGSVDRIGADVAPLARLRARHGVFFVTGNHEYYSGVEPWLTHLPQIGLRVLTNERVSIGDAGASFDLAGVPDHRAGAFIPSHEPSVARAVEGRRPDRELVLLAHQPVEVGAAAAHGVGLQLSGHTHGGQLWPFGGLTLLSQPYVKGLHRHGDSTQIYVTRGVGFWGPPMRVLAPPEIARVILTV